MKIKEGVFALFVGKKSKEKKNETEVRSSFSETNLLIHKQCKNKNVNVPFNAK